LFSLSACPLDIASLSPLSLHDALPIFIGDSLQFVVAGIRVSVRMKEKVVDAVELLAVYLSVGGQFQHPVQADGRVIGSLLLADQDRKSTRLNSSHVKISYAVFCLKKKN